RDGAARGARPLRRRHSSGEPGRARAHDPPLPRRRVRPRGDGPPRARVRGERVGPHGRDRPLPRRARRGGRMTVLVVLFWASLAALVWTHVAYPAVWALLARVAPRRVRRAEHTPSVTVIVAAHDEESVIERRIANLRQIDYPRDRLELVVTSDASSDRTEELAESAGARVIRNPRGGKVAAQDRAVRETGGAIVAFSAAN